MRRGVERGREGQRGEGACPQATGEAAGGTLHQAGMASLCLAPSQALNAQGQALPSLQGAGVQGPAPSSASLLKESQYLPLTGKKMCLMLFVIAAIQREANFGNRLLKNISTLSGTINQVLQMQIHPVLWAFLGCSPALPRPPFLSGCPGSAPWRPGLGLWVPVRTVGRPGFPLAYSSGAVTTVRIAATCAGVRPGFSLWSEAGDPSLIP